MVYEIVLSGSSLNKTFLYSYNSDLQIGERVYVNYKGKKSIAYVIDKKNESGNFKEILNRIDGRSFLPEWYVKIIRKFQKFITPLLESFLIFHFQKV